MSTCPTFEHDEFIRHISRDLTDGYDEELEMEIEDRHPLPDGASSPAQADAETDYRRERKCPACRKTVTIRARRRQTGANFSRAPSTSSSAT
jgi:hypothetical protein